MGRLAIEPSPKQLQVLRSVNTWTAVFCGRMFGKSTIGALLAGNRLTHGQSILIIAPTYSMLRNSMIRMVRKILDEHGYKRNKHYSFNGSTNDLVLWTKGGEDVYCYFRSAENYEAIRSVDNVSVLIVDEAALVERECVEIAMACVRGPNVVNPQYFLLSTPRGRANYMAEIYLDERGIYGTLAITGTSYDNPHVSRKSIDNLIAMYGEDFADQEIYAKILDSTESGLFKAVHVTKLKTSLEHIAGEIVFGFDVAGSGADYSAITVRNGNQLIAIEKRRTPDDAALIAFFDDMYNRYLPTRANIDASGLGHFLPSRLKPMYPSCAMCGMNFSERRKEGFKNLRTQIYFDLRDHINKGLHFSGNISAQIISEIAVELYATEYTLDGQTDFKLISKDDIKAKINRSPDISDSLALACAETGELAQSIIDSGMQRLKSSLKKSPIR